jgi:hypothetical protein
MGRQPLGEVFGTPIDAVDEQTLQIRSKKLCPFAGPGRRCNKDKAENPLGVCSVNHAGQANPTITCPTRFLESGIVAKDAAEFFFGPNASWSFVPEVKLKDVNGKAAGNIDLVIYQKSKAGDIVDFGSVEIQAVYISGNVREPFDHFMKLPPGTDHFDWSNSPLYPRPDFLSSSRKRLIPQLMYKGGILKSWGKKQAVVLDKAFLSSLPTLQTVRSSDADLVWLVYDLVRTESIGPYKLTLVEKIYTDFNTTMSSLSSTQAGTVESFVIDLHRKISQAVGQEGNHEQE